MAHTLGTWYANYDIVDLADSETGNDEHPIAVCKGPDAKENARLIAAAPDLLEHGERALAALEEAVEIGGGDPKTHHACANLRAAIAKAKGSAP